MIALAGLALALTGAFGAALLRRSWRHRQGMIAPLVAGGWLVMSGATVLAMLAIGPVKGLALAATMQAAGALAVVWQGRVQRQPARAPRGEASMGMGDAAPEPLEQRARLWRGVLRVLLAGPLGMVAALALALCLAVYPPGDPRTRIVLSGLATPVLWGLAMTWTLADRRLLRALAMLVGTSLLGLGIAALGDAA
ncbi:hypothetical protein ABIC78_000582 [Novosphingobium sp. 1529]|uniref:hypothetical protein n=1 Tax=Novosphingobium sp. 1529 TaxID=3156424 RepID=UPI0017FEB693